MNETRFASLTPSLLARKGAARPAMRPQVQPLTLEAQGLSLVDAHDDLGWNDMGHSEAPDVRSAEPASEPAVVAIAANVSPRVSPSQPEVLRRIESLAERITGKAPGASRRNGSALKEGRKAAFTLRLDADRHLRLRLACTLENRSAQLVVIEALDRFLETVPGLDDLARRARRS